MKYAVNLRFFMIIERTTSKMACKPGFFGTYCELHCPPGNFGEDCGGVCSPICPTSECDRVYGCSKINGKILEASTKGPFMASNNSTMNPGFVTTSEENVIFTKTLATMESSLNNTDKQGITLKNYLITSQNSVHVATEQPLAKDSFTTLYILVGLGPVISLFLFVVVGQLYKKYKTSKQKPLSKTQYDEHCVFSDLPQEGNRASYSRASEFSGTVHIYRPFEAEYEEINESVEVEIGAMDSYETPISPCGGLPKIQENNRSGSYVNNSNAEHTVEGFNKAANSSDTYLTPLFVSEIQRSFKKEESNAYINATK